MLAVAEAARNVACAGAVPIGATNNLNFGNPQRPEIMWQFAEAVAGIGEACRAFEMPITGGNVSLYNETDGRAILPDAGARHRRAHRRSRRRCSDARSRRRTPRSCCWARTAASSAGASICRPLHGLIRGVPPALDLAQRARAADAAAGARVARS